MTSRKHTALLLAMSLFALLGCASGTAIVTGTTRSPLSSHSVSIYLEPPADFEVIGLVSASSDAGFTEQGSMDYAVEELKKQAGKLGANGVLLISSGEKRSTKTLQGRAIFVRRK